jgi:hypothetical protein
MIRSAWSAAVMTIQLAQLATDNEPVNSNAARPWAFYEVHDLKAATKSGYAVDHIAVYLSRTAQEVRDKAAELGLHLGK